MTASSSNLADGAKSLRRLAARDLRRAMGSLQELIGCTEGGDVVPLRAFDKVALQLRSCANNLDALRGEIIMLGRTPDASPPDELPQEAKAGPAMVARRQRERETRLPPNVISLADACRRRQRK